MRLPSNTVIALIAGLFAAGLAFWSAFADEAENRVSGPGYSDAIFAGGCFWCVESDFDKLDGVVDTISGYSGGSLDNPSYREVTSSDTGHYEAVRVVYDPQIISYEELVDYFWRHIDPTDAGGQFCDRGDSYRTAIFAGSDEERAYALASKNALNALGTLPGDIVTPVLDRSSFWRAEEKHQNYYQRNPIRYNFYRNGCGRDKRVREVWKNTPDQSELTN